MKPVEFRERSKEVPYSEGEQQGSENGVPVLEAAMCSGSGQKCR